MTEEKRNRMELVDKFRNDLMDKFIDLCRGNDYNKLTLLKIGDTIDQIYDEQIACIRAEDTADVVEVVRCKDCFWRQSFCDRHTYKGRPMMYCFCHSRIVKEDGYCNEAIKKPETNPDAKSINVGKFTANDKSDPS